MALKLPGIKQMFSHSRNVEVGVGNVRVGQATIVVALDGTGDTDSIQDGINLLPSNGGVIYIKEGTYILTEQVLINKTNVKIQGAGFSTVIKNYGFLIKSWKGGNHTIIEDMQLDGNSTGASGVEIKTEASGIIEQIIIKDLNITGFTSHGINIWSGVSANDIYDIKIIDNKIVSNGGSGIYCGSGDDMYPIIISGNYILSSGGYGIYMSDSSQGVLISDNLVWISGEEGIRVNGYGDTISGNYIASSQKHGLHVLSERSSITGNTIIQSGIATVSTYSDMYVNNAGNTITGNVCKEVGATTLYNIHLDTNADNGVCVGNVTEGATTNIQNDGTGNAVANNVTI